MKNSFSLKISTLLLSVLLIAFSCSEENIETEENDSSLNKELLLKNTPALEVILDMGFSIEDIIENKDSYIIEGDLLFPKEPSFYENLQSNNRLSNSNCRYGPSIVNTTDLLGNFSERTITIYSALDPLGQINELPVWSSALSHAVFQLNSISPSSCLKFEIVYNPLLADIRIIHDPSLINGAYALAGVQSGNNPFPIIRINRNRTNIFSTAISRSNTILHEIIHCLGFNGHQGSNSIMFPDPASLAFDGLRNIDKNDFKCVYDNCQDIINDTVSISGTTEFCVNSNIHHTYTLSDNTLNPSWSVTPNLIINSSNNTSVTISPVNTGISSIGIITAMFQNGSTATYNINITGRPTPNGSTIVSGPNILQYYQSGLFYVSENSFDNYNNVEWVVYSYNFQNAIQHFNIQSPAGNNQFNALIEVLPTAPPGNYVVQCRVSNDCGTYYIDKSFTVRSGPPQIFGL